MRVFAGGAIGAGDRDGVSEEVIPATLLDHEAGNRTLGHRFMSSGEIVIEDANSYVESLRNHSVIANFEARVESIRTHISALSDSLKSVVIIDESLLEEVAALVEWPVALTGNFDESFLQDRADKLIAVMALCYLIRPVFFGLKLKMKILAIGWRQRALLKIR